MSAAVTTEPGTVLRGSQLLKLLDEWLVTLLGIALGIDSGIGWRMVKCMLPKALRNIM